MQKEITSLNKEIMQKEITSLNKEINTSLNKEINEPQKTKSYFYDSEKGLIHGSKEMNNYFHGKIYDDHSEEEIDVKSEKSEKESMKNESKDIQQTPLQFSKLFRKLFPVNFDKLDSNGERIYESVEEDKSKKCECENCKKKSI